MKQFLACVAVENVAYHFDILYGYLIPQELSAQVKKGSLVTVGFGRGKTTKRQGVVFSIDEEEIESKIKYKKILSVFDDVPPLSEEAISIAEFLKERTFCTYFEAVKAQLPAGFYHKIQIKYVALKRESSHKLSLEEQRVYDYMSERGIYLSEKEIKSALSIKKTDEILKKLVSFNLVAKNYEATKGMSDASIKTAILNINPDEAEPILSNLSEKQKNVLNVLLDTGSASVKELCYFTGVTSSVVATLAKKGLVKIVDREKFRIPECNFNSADGEKKEIILTGKQSKAYNNILEKYKSGGGASLLYGITGSGKTSVFLKLIDDVIADGRQAIVMVPEIALTPQMMSIFKGRYGEEVAIFHSALSMGERRDEYKRVASGKVKIAVGTRSAVFAPFDNIGIIVIDEEQEHTYKSESSPRYDTKDVAKFRIARHRGLLLLSSATPSVESYSNALKGRYSLEKLDERYGNAILPDVTVVDMKAERRNGNKYNLSSSLLELIEKNLNDKKQSILLINRRGFNTFVACDSCGSVINCPQCSISLTYHSANNRLMCHYCGYSVPMTKTCPECGKDDVRYAGYGTQRVEQELGEIFPEAKILRMDADSTSSRGDFEKNLNDFGSGKYDIMLGTQMVAKGLNFENVTLVGVINADQQLNNDDFRSEERTFDLLTQVVGRSGRGNNKGVAVIQTMTPENHIIRLAQRQDYESFFEDEIIIRKTLIYPPYCDICSICFVSENEFLALDSSRNFLNRLRESTNSQYKEQKIIALGPMPPRISKINNKYRYRIIIKCKNSKRFRNMISELIKEFEKNSAYSDVTFVADINPENLV